MLRADLVWSTDASTGNHVLYDPLTGAAFTLTAEQRSIIESGSLADYDELESSLSKLHLLASESAPAEIIAAQRTERRRLVAEAQREKFDAQLTAMRTQIPFYRQWLSKLDSNLCMLDVERIPLLRKADLRAATKDPLALVPNHPASGDPGGAEPMMDLTSGTTAERFHIATEPGYKVRIVDQLLGQNRRVREAFKAQADMRVCTIASPLFDDAQTPIGATGRSRPLEERRRGRDLRFDTPGNIFTLPVEKLDQVLDEARDFVPGALIGDPVYLAALAAHARKRRARLPVLRFVITSFELASEVSQRIIESVFECPVYDLYSATEFGSPAIECEHGQYHVCEDAFLVELLDEGRPVGPGALGTIVVTTLEKRYTPLLRYDSGDLARAASSPCACPFSHSLSFDSLEGRSSDVVTDQAGAPVTARAVDRAVARATGFSFYGLMQTARGEYHLRVIPDDTYSDATPRRLQGELHDLFGAGASIHVEPVAFLEPEPSGKFRLSQKEPPSVTGGGARRRRAGTRR